MSLTREQIAGGLTFADDLPLVYLLNAKAGCSTVKAALWRWLDRARGTDTFDRSPHLGRQFADLDRTRSTPAEIAARPTFSMVRNPYARALSTYLSKIVGRGDPRIQAKFRTRFGLKEGVAPSFAEFLAMIEREPPEAADPHWALQLRNLLQPVARVDHLFYLEQVDELERFLEATLRIAMPRFERNRRDAVEKLSEAYDEGTRRRVARLYAADFEAFGYSEDPSQQAPCQPIGRLPGIDGALEAVIAAVSGPPGQARESAVERFAALVRDDYLVDLLRLRATEDRGLHTALAGRVAAAARRNLPVLELVEATLLGDGDPAAAMFARLKAEAIAALSRG